MQWRHPKRLLMSSAAGGRRQPASRHQSCNTPPLDVNTPTIKDGHTNTLCEVRKALICPGVSRSYRKAKTISRKGRESLFPCTTLLHCSFFSPFPLWPLRHLIRLAMEKISLLFTYLSHTPQ
jgi:hypothetical protein